MKKIFILLFVSFALSFPKGAFSQNVGIGTTAPDRLLHIKGFGEVLRVQGSHSWIGFMNDTDPSYGGFLYYPDTSLVMGSRAGTNLPLIIAPNNEGLLFATGNQRIGVGNPAPAEKLDVTGNINLTGTIKANGTDGTAGQVLMKNSSGSLAWGDMCEFKNIATFTSGTGAWTVPAGVTKVWVEAWGGGGGGNWYSGGGGGGYVSGIFSVTSGNLVGYQVGAGGSGSTSNATSGGPSVVFYTPGSITLTATAGVGATFIVSPPIITGATGGGYTISSGFTSFIGNFGAGGKPSIANVLQYSATAFYEIASGGDGGDGANTNATGGLGSYFIFNTSTSAEVRSKLPHSGKMPGGGGGAGWIGTIGSSGNSQGASGGAGMVIIHY